MAEAVTTSSEYDPSEPLITQALRIVGIELPPVTTVEADEMINAERTIDLIEAEEIRH